jgi:hypothetical protein
MKSYKVRLRKLSGKRSRYHAEFQRIWCEAGGRVRADLRAIQNQNRAWTVGDLVAIIDRHGLPFRATVLTMEQEGFLSTGIYNALERRGLDLERLRAEMEGKADATSPERVAVPEASLSPNTRHWRSGDIVMHAQAPKSRLYLLRIVAWNGAGGVLMRYVDSRLPRTVRTGTIGVLIDPLCFGIDANGER